MNLAAKESQQNSQIQLFNHSSVILLIALLRLLTLELGSDVTGRVHILPMFKDIDSRIQVQVPGKIYKWTVNQYGWCLSFPPSLHLSFPWFLSENKGEREKQKGHQAPHPRKNPTGKQKKKGAMINLYHITPLQGRFKTKSWIVSCH